MSARVGRKLLPAFTAIAVLAGGGVVWAQDGAPAGSGSKANCVVPSDKDLAARQSAPRMSHFPYQDWIARPDAQAGVTIVNDAVDARFGNPDAGDDPLRAGLIGIAADHHARQLVVVVDPTLVNGAALEDSLGRAVARTPLHIRVSPSCNSAAELLAARAVIERATWHLRASETPRAFYLDDRTSTFNVSFAERDRDVADALKLALGDAVTIEWGEPVRDDRLNDGEPHYGGAGIHAGYESSNTCTSAFTAVMPGGNKGSVTAGHCYGNGRNIYSGNQFYGETDGNQGFPTYDMVRIEPRGETFDRKIHVDPCCPSVRNVVAANNPDEEQFVCISGMMTRAVCGIEIIDRDATLCSGGCTPNLTHAKKSGATVAVGGDSGAPIYNRFGTDDAAIRGMHIGHAGAPNDTYFHKVSTIKDHLNVSGIAP